MKNFKEALNFLKNIAEEKGITYPELFVKDELLENIAEYYFDWSIQDEIENNHLSKEEAIKVTNKWLKSKDNYDLLKHYISEDTERELVIEKAKELGFVAVA